MGAPERSVRNGRIVRQRRHADGLEIGDSESHQNGHHDGPRKAEANQPFQQCAEGPGQHDGLDSNIRRRVMNHPVLKSAKDPSEHERVKDNQTPRT